MRNKKQLVIDQLDKRIQPFLGTRHVVVPQKGWINNIRTSLNMTMAQLGSKLNITRQAINKIEDSEVNGSISLRKLKDVAEAMDLKLVYCMVPHDGTMDQMIQIKAENLARYIVMRTNQSMKLEAQEIGDDKLNKTIQELAYEIKRELKKSLWD